MIAHARDELTALADGCVLVPQDPVQGWLVDSWLMEDDDAERAIAAYNALLLGAVDEATIELLREEGIDLPALLVDEGRDDITRSDLTEIVAAATMLVVSGWTLDELHMPNVPKMSRRKSDSGIDVFGVRLEAAETEGLHDHDLLAIASVKHTAVDDAPGVRYNVANSLGPRELSTAYLSIQLRVLNGNLLAEGIPPQIAVRVYRFLGSFRTSPAVELYGIAFSSPNAEADLHDQPRLLPTADSDNHRFRMVFVPGLPTIHERCD